MAIEALIQWHIRNSPGGTDGPKNVYECEECGNWHLTSKGMNHSKLRDSEILEYIRKERRAFEWEQKLR